MRYCTHLVLLLACIGVVSTQDSSNCLNQGQLSVGHCLCPPNFIGQKCQIAANPLSAKLQPRSLTQQYKYFYFQPQQVNFYRLNFTICMKSNPQNIATLFFVTTQKTNGSLKQTPAFFQTYKLLLPQKTCTNFSSHYISIQRRQDSTYRKIIVGMKIFTKKDNTFYFNVFKGKNITQKEQKSMMNKTVEVLDNQDVQIKMEYQLYLETSYQNSFIILTTSLVLMLVLGAVLNYIRRKYIQREEEEARPVYNYSMRELFREARRNNPEYYYQGKNDITVLEVFMPSTEYGTQCKFFSSQNCQLHSQTPQGYPSNQGCSICLVEFQAQDKVRTTPCKHRYHKECIDNWCQTNLSCPICRRGLDFQRELRIIYMRHLRGQLSL